jgi:UDP-N-acetylglucosamine 3-dehydrogenase
MTVSVAVVGAGFMGTNHARVLSALPGATLAAIVDRDQSRGRLVAAEFECDYAASMQDVAVHGRAGVAALDLCQRILDAAKRD